MTKYSIITVNYNNCDGLRRTIESVIGQTFNDYEFIVIDGGSTDGSIDVIKEHQQQLTYWVSEKDAGIYQAMNKGIRVAKGEYLNFMNSGDTLYDNSVLSTMNQETDGTDIVVGRDYHYNETTHQGFASVLPSRISMITFFLETLPHQGAFIRRELFDNSLYDETLLIAADWAFYVKKIIVESSSLKLVPVIVCQREQGGISSTRSQEQTEERTRVLHQLLPNGAYKDYETLGKLDRSTIYKFMNLCERPTTRRLLTLCIKILNRLFK